MIKAFKIPSFESKEIEYLNHQVYGEIPKKLYKYRDWNNSNHRKILSVKQIHFSSPKELNDPFDCLIHTDYTILRDNQEHERVHWNNHFNQAFPNDSETERANRISEIINNKIFHNDERMETQRNLEFEALNQTFGILSTSLTSDNILMWSHYADNHKGFCVGFDSVKLFDTIKGKGMGGLVDYQKTYPLVNPLSETEEKMHKQLATKSLLWNYELEYRVIKLVDSGRVVPFLEDVISELILGTNIEPANKLEILSIIEKYYPHVKVLQAKIKKAEFGLDLIPL